VIGGRLLEARPAQGGSLVREMRPVTSVYVAADIEHHGRDGSYGSYDEGVARVRLDFEDAPTHTLLTYSTVSPGCVNGSLAWSWALMLAWRSCVSFAWSERYGSRAAPPCPPSC
jgi:hypothetical protein